MDEDCDNMISIKSKRIEQVGEKISVYVVADLKHDTTQAVLATSPEFSISLNRDHPQLKAAIKDALLAKIREWKDDQTRALQYNKQLELLATDLETELNA